MEGNTQGLAELVGNIFAVPQIDKTLTKDGYGADAKVVGEKLTEVENKITKVNEDIEKQSDAKNITYNGKDSGLEAGNVNNAIDEVHAFQKNGGRVGGRIDFGNPNFNNGYGAVNKNNSVNVDYGTQLVDIDKNGKTASLSVSALMGTATYTDMNGKIHNLFTSKNKPFGSYIGNGGTNVVDTGGVGRFLLLYMDTFLAFVTPKGALKVALSSGEIEWLDGQYIWYLDGKLTLGAATPFNLKDIEYSYQVI